MLNSQFPELIYADSSDKVYIRYGKEGCLVRNVTPQYNYIKAIRDFGHPDSWISVKDALPSNGQKVLFTCKNGDTFVGEFRQYESGNTDWVIRGAKGRKMYGRQATHWMHLPRRRGKGVTMSAVPIVDSVSNEELLRLSANSMPVGELMNETLHEIAELTSAITKGLRDHERHKPALVSIENIFKGIANVELILEQCKLKCQCTKDVDKYKEQKLDDMRKEIRDRGNYESV